MMRKTFAPLFIVWAGVLCTLVWFAWSNIRQTAVNYAVAQADETIHYYYPFFIRNLERRDIAVPRPENPTATSTPQPTHTPLPTGTTPPTSTTSPTSTPQPTQQITPTPTVTIKPTATKRPFPRHGVAVANWETVIEQSKRLGDWSHQWYAYNGTYPTDHEIVPMLVFSTGLPSVDVIAEIDQKTDKATGHDYWLVFNECEAWQQCDKLPESQAVLYGEHILPTVALGDANAKLIVGGSIANTRGLEWMSTFVETYRETFGEEPPRAGWHFHIYPEVDSSPTIENFVRDAENFKQWLQRYGSPEDEVWLTEIGCLAAELCLESESYMLEILAYLNSEDGAWITRYAWFTTYTTPECLPCGNSPGTHLLERESPHDFTPLGNLYAAYFDTPTPAPTATETAVSTPVATPNSTESTNAAYP